MLAILAAARFAHFTAATLLFGLLAFPFYAPVPGEAGKTPVWIVRTLAVASALTIVLVLAVSTANMTGDALAAFSPGAIWDITQATVFGRVWGLRLLLAVVVALLSLWAKPKDPVLTPAAALLLISVAYSGHSRMDDGALGLAHIFADALHLMAAGAWLGGLLALILLVPRLLRLEREHLAARVLHQFSEMGYAAVGVIAFTGFVKSVLLVGAPITLITTPYGRVLTVKLLLFAGMGALALSNRLWISPALTAKPADARLWLGRLKLQVTVELGLGLLVLAAVGFLGAMAPSIEN